MVKIAIVEDDINMRKSLEISLDEYKEFEIISFKNAKDAIKGIDDSFELIITDINMPDIDGIEFIKKLDGRFEIIVITGNATLNRAIDAIRLGVKDFLTKPFEVDTLVNAINRSAKVQKKTKKISIKTQENDKTDSLFLGKSKKLDKILSIAKKAANSNATIMLLGESGVGKELFAKFVHKNSKREKMPFIAINMAAIPENLLESELFGYEKGAFTDAVSTKKGFFELADKGSIFLDELAEMPLSLQAKILRVLQEKELVRVGGSKSIKIDIRVICATNADIFQRVQDKKFREDLYYRLNTIPLTIPPLRQRKEEISEIAIKTLKKVCTKYDLGDKSFSEEALASLFSYNWPGNIRELISVVERAAILSDENKISKDDLFLQSRK
jgi:two-component system NtrC family response regulator